MRITALLFRRNRMPHGNIYTGKDRVMPEVTLRNLRSRLHLYEIEERNMLLLRHPYLSEDQSRGHARALNKQETFIRTHHDNYRMRRKDDVTIGERLAHLNVKDAWEVY